MVDLSATPGPIDAGGTTGLLDCDAFAVLGNEKARCEAFAFGEGAQVSPAEDIHANSPVLALDRLALMVTRTGTRLTRADVLEHAARTIDLIVQVGRDEGRRGVEEVYMPALALKI